MYNELFYQKETVKTFEIELTSYCNAFCGACHRNKNGGKLQNYVNLKHMDKDTWDSIINKSNLEYIEKFLFDGNLGDASMHPDLISMLEQLSKIKSDVEIRISTNGGARSADWWANLAKCLQKFKYHQVSFNVDGLKDTNHIYRRNVNWDSLVKNIKSFNNNGGISFWRAIIFDHNKDQVYQMSNTAKELGCFSFYTYRNRQPIIHLNEYKNKLPGGIITSPSVEEFNKKHNYLKIFKKINYYINPPHLVSDKYSCPFAEEGKVSIDENGYIWPCCFTSTQIEGRSNFPVKYYKSFNNIKHNSLEVILENFRKDLYNAWDKNEYNVCNKCLHKTSPPTTYKSNQNTQY